MKKKQKQNILFGGIAAAIIIAIIVYNFSAEQTRQKGFVFGNELEKIQNDVKDLQTKFDSMKIQLEEGSITEEELFQFYENHVVEFEEIILRYEQLKAPEDFQSSVDLLKLSSETQLESDKQFIEWVKTGDESYKVRSDSLYQQTFEYEMRGLVEYYSAKTGIDPEN